MERIVKLSLFIVLVLTGCSSRSNESFIPVENKKLDQNHSNTSPAIADSKNNVENLVVAQNNNQEQNIANSGSENDSNNKYSSNSKIDNRYFKFNGFDVEIIERTKGKSCETSGPDSRYKDLPIANDKYDYIDPFKTISFKMPYNKNWKFDGCEIGPFSQYDDNGNFEISFGMPSAWGPDDYQMNIVEIRSIEDIQKELFSMDDFGFPEDQMKKIIINRFNAFRWQENGMVEMINIEIVGKKYNYRFTSALINEKELIKIIESLKLL